MSDRAPCNYCKLIRIRESAFRAGLSIALTCYPLTGRVKVYTVDRGQLIGGEPMRVIGWFETLTDHCVC